ncbi:centrosomal protein of 44 kDa [Apodemus sylvaticus]|uniref:centrosomal protein of 44 kDa n=1 Tax=Apodemus sylvaticus TaxID=10129 RepID=UPI002244F26F|nr:centrosomal protein of 44 kDa [Apodemus sylvaticus]XP_052018852.1 centrosomal protein of 44 kDa [Apodemus sylvaticus]XP_052018853.1 centrosomal protein of 44 kDa [Apodemus sylvaticus]XP_052018854.1 centrosomal protein of 44 kDa [Apodemus sylvaticus]XP_052018855.1 centrosomal protein of 44 kDa [Apodemus sylvaticus]XP_052018856.1 centrosomal protein of 44 kDa [Apodemus sylvaticus]
MATGDLKRSLRKLEQVLRSLNYPNEVDYVGLMKGDTAASLPIISYSLTSYSPHVAELLMESSVELIAKNDVRFTDTVYKLLRDQFDYKPILTKKQFIQSGFAEWKIEIVCDILNCVMKKHKELIGLDKNTSCLKKKNISEKPEPCSSSEKRPAEAVGIDITGRFMTSGKKKAVVIRHLYTEEKAGVPEGMVTSAGVSEGCAESEEQSSDSRIPEAQAPEVKAELQDMCDNPEITALQTALAECQEKLKQLTWIEKRLECLEATASGKVMVDEKAWNNLLSRVTLLETEMLLSKKNESVERNTTSEDCESISDVDVAPYDKNCSVGGPASNYHSSGYSAVSWETTPRSSTVNYCVLRDFSEETTIQKMERMKKMFEETAELLKCSSR